LPAPIPASLFLQEPVVLSFLPPLKDYILRNPFSVEKMTLESPTDMVIYRSRLNAKLEGRLETGARRL